MSAAGLSEGPSSATESRKPLPVPSALTVTVGPLSAALVISSASNKRSSPREPATAGSSEISNCDCGNFSLSDAASSRPSAPRSTVPAEARWMARAWAAWDTACISAFARRTH